MLPVLYGSGTLFSIRSVCNSLHLLTLTASSFPTSIAFRIFFYVPCIVSQSAFSPPPFSSLSLSSFYERGREENGEVGSSLSFIISFCSLLRQVA